MKKTILLFGLVALIFISCKKKESTTVERSSAETYYLNMAAYTTNPQSVNATNNVFEFNIQDNIDAGLVELGYDVKKWKITLSELNIESITFSNALSGGLGDAIDSVQISISNDNFASKETLIFEKMIAGVNTLSTYSFVASQFQKSSLLSYFNENAKISIKLIPKAGTSNAQDFNSTLNLKYKLKLDEE